MNQTINKIYQLIRMHHKLLMILSKALHFLLLTRVSKNKTKEYREDSHDTRSLNKTYKMNILKLEKNLHTYH